MFDQLIGKKAILKCIEEDGTVEHYNLTVLAAEGCLVTVRDIEGKVRVINMSASHNIELKQQ
jgi:hypothetical protein